MAFLMFNYNLIKIVKFFMLMLFNLLFNHIFYHEYLILIALNHQILFNLKSNIFQYQLIFQRIK